VIKLIRQKVRDWLRMLAANKKPEDERITDHIDRISFVLRLFFKNLKVFNIWAKELSASAYSMRKWLS